jgi:glycosyltransferase involved in cell wall biosynthesis
MISFIIPAHNEARLIGGTIEALHAAARACGEPYEIVAVDDDSTDATTDAARHAGARVVAVKARQIAAVRNAGAQEARGNRFVFVDADTIVTPAVLREVIAAFGGGAVGGGAPVRFDGPVPLWGRVGIRLWLMVQRVAGLASGCLLFATREAFEACGGFDPGLFVAEDVELSRRLRRQGRFVVIGEPVVTSGRMVRSFGFWEMAGIALGALRHGFLFHRRRTGHWYVARRESPAPAGPPTSSAPPPVAQRPPGSSAPH